MKRKVELRSTLDAVRVETDKNSDTIRAFVLKNLDLKKSYCFKAEHYLDYKFLFSLGKYFPEEKLAVLKYPPFRGRVAADLLPPVKLVKRVRERDVFLAYPFDSMEPLIRLLNECADDPRVAAIKITIYRLDNHSRIVEALKRASENGKEVTVVIELCARFDEENNMYYAGILQEAGCTIIYGMQNYYESQLESKKKEVKRNAKTRLEILNKELDAFLNNPEITQKVINNYTYGLVRTAMSEEAARKNYIIEYVKSILIAEHAYAMDFRDRNKRISQILQYAYRKKGSSKGSLFDETEIGNILGSYGIGFSQMLTRKIQDCCNKGALEGRASFPFYKEDSPFTVTKAAMGFSHEYDSYEELCEHVKDCKLYFDYGGNGKPHIARFQIDLGHGRNRDKLMATLLKVYSGEYAYCGSSIQILKNKIVLNLSLQIPKEEKDELDKDTVVGVAIGLVQPAVCALNNDQYVRLPIGDERDLLDNKLQIQERRRRLQSALRETSGGHGRKKKMQALNRIAKTESNFTETYCHMVSKRIVEFALQNNAKYINMENLSGICSLLHVDCID